MRNSVSKQDLEKAIAHSKSVKEVMQFLGWKVNNGNYLQIRSLALRHNVELPVYNPRDAITNVSPRQKISDEDFFALGTERAGVGLRKRMVRLGIPYTCSNPLCILHGESEWNGIKLVFQVDHINGDRFDNRLENLRFLCPNCHSQTETFGAANVTKYGYCECGVRKYSEYEGCIHLPDCLSCGEKCKDRTSVRCQKCAIDYKVENGTGIQFDYPPLDEMISRIEEIGYLAYSKELDGISDNGIRKHLRRNNVNPLPKKLTKKELLLRN